MACVGTLVNSISWQVVIANRHVALIVMHPSCMIAAFSAITGYGRSQTLTSLCLVTVNKGLKFALAAIQPLSSDLIDVPKTWWPA